MKCRMPDNGVFCAVSFSAHCTKKNDCRIDTKEERKRVTCMFTYISLEKHIHQTHALHNMHGWSIHWVFQIEFQIFEIFGSKIGANSAFLKAHFWEPKFQNWPSQALRGAHCDRIGAHPFFFFGRPKASQMFTRFVFFLTCILQMAVPFVGGALRHQRQGPAKPGNAEANTIRSRPLILATRDTASCIARMCFFNCCFFLLVT